MSEEIKKEEEKVKTHPRLGKYLKVKVTALSSAEKNTSLHASIGLDSFDVHQNTFVELPEAIVELFENSLMVKHGQDENGHGKKEMVPAYAVSVKR